MADGVLAPGVVVASNYRIVKQLGAGGFGTVFLAENLTLEQRVVVKVLRGERGLGAEEARVLASLDAPNVVHVYAYDEKYDCIVMQFLAGESLFAQRHKLDIVAAVRVVYEVALALAAVHARGLVHRDVKPENVMAELKAGEVAWVKLIDLGTAMTIGRTTEHPSGTPQYCAPEQFDGSIGANPANDVYALGVMLFELCAQRLPFDLADPVELGLAHTSRAVPELVATRQAASGDRRPEPLEPRVEHFLGHVGELVTKMMAKQPAARPDAMAVARRLTELEREFSSERTQVAFKLPGPIPIPLVNRAKTSTMILPRGPTTEQALASVHRSDTRRATLVALAVAALLLVTGVIAFSMKGVSASQEALSAPIAVASREPAVVDAGRVVAAVLPELEPLAPQPSPDASVAVKARPVGSRTERPTALAARGPSARFEVTSTGCEPDEEWKKASRRSMEELLGIVTKKRPERLEWAGDRETELSRAIASATTRGDCAKVEAQLIEFEKGVNAP